MSRVIIKNVRLIFYLHTFFFFIFLFQAKRSGMDCVILPEENRKDYCDLPEFIRDGLEVHFASNYADVFNVLFTEEQMGDDQRTTS